MSAPTNISAATATSIDLNTIVTQRVDDSGTTYTVWYKYFAAQTGTVGVFGFGDLTTYTPGYTVYFNNGTTQYMNYNALPNNDATLPNRPFLMPVVEGNTYYLQFSPNSGNPSPATLTLSIEGAPSGPVAIGDVLSNRETDDQYEHPLTISSPSDGTVRGFVQLGTPLPTPVTVVGLPHGDQGAILPDGHFLYIDDTFGTGKIFDANMLLVKLITKYESPLPDLIKIGSNRTSSHFVVCSIISTTATVDTYDTLGTLISTKTLSGVSSIGPCCINNDGTIFYFSTTGSNSVIKKYIISSDTLSTLATVTGFDISDLLYLEDGSLLGIFLETGGGSPPLQAKALKFDLTGSITNTYDFGSSWRDDFNPPRIGYALDSPASFWVTLKPQTDFQISEIRNIKVSDGSTISSFDQTNYLFGQYIGVATATPTSRFGPEKSFSLLVAPVAGNSDLNVFVGTRQTLKIRRERTVPIPVLPGNARQKISRLELQFQPGTGLPSDPTTSPNFFVRMSWDNGKTWSNERLMQAGREGAYITRAFVNLLGAGRFPVVQVVTSDTFLPVLTNAFFTGADGVH